MTSKGRVTADIEANLGGAQYAFEQGHENALAMFLASGLLTEAAERLHDLEEIKGYATEVMNALGTYGPSIVPHLLDTDDNAGELLRQAIYALERQKEGPR